MIRILALQRESHVAPGVPSLSVAARITEVLEYLESVGHVSFTSISEYDDCAAAGVNWSDVLILSKHSSPIALALAMEAKKRGVLVIYDIDDWIFSFPTYSGAQVHRSRLDLIYKIIGLSDIVTVANLNLQRKLEGLVPTTVLVPNGMWVEKYVTFEQGEDLEAYPPRIVFTNADFLKMQTSKDMLLSALQVFFLRNPHYILDFYGDPFPEIFSLPFLHFTNRMPYSEYMRALVSGRYQFAITPLGGAEDSEAEEFNACKNPFKYLNYGAAKVPGIYSEASIYINSVTHEKTGLLTDNSFSSWITTLDRMANDNELRQLIRQNAAQDIINNYHIKSSADALLGAITAHLI